jgi:hypothetical protein
MSLKNLTAVAVLDRAPSDEEAETLAFSLIARERPEITDDPRTSISWFSALTLPPVDFPLFEQDQLLATKRDAGEAGVYFVILVERV